MRRLVFALLLLAIASAIPIDIGFNYANNSYFLQEQSYTFTITITNRASVNDTIDVYFDVDGTAVLVNGSSSYSYTLTNLTTNGSSSKSVAVKVTNSAKFGSLEEFCVEAYDSNGTSNSSCLVMRIPGFSGIGASISYTPAQNASATLKVNGTTSNGASTTRFNTTYSMQNSTVVCANGSSNATTIAISPANCSTGLYDIVVKGTADGFTRTKTIRDFFLYRNITFTTSFYRVEQFGYERPIEEIGQVKGNDKIHVNGSARYDDGTALSWPPDSYSDSPISLTISNSTYTARPHEDGTYFISFTAPTNTSSYAVSLVAHGAHSLDAKISYTLKVNNTKSYMPKKVNSTEVLGNVGLSISGNGTTLNVTVSNNNTISVTGKPTLIGESQFTASEPPSDSVLGKRERVYSLAITPKKYTAPGSYNVMVGFATIYGTVKKAVPIIIPSPPLDSSKVSVFRYVEYSPNSKITLKAINPLPSRANVAIREVISKSITSTLTSISSLLSTTCNETNYSCRLSYVLNNGSCSDCSLVGGNLSSNCTVGCTNRTSLSFSPPYTRVVKADPIVEWDLQIAAGGSVEVHYTTGKRVDESWFSEPNYTYSIEKMATPTPAPSPIPSAIAESMPSATPSVKAGNNILLLVIIVAGFLFLMLVAAAAVVAYLFLKKRDEVDDFLSKYLPKEPGPTKEDIEREKIRKMFIGDKAIPKKIAEKLSPKKREEGPTAFSPVKKEQPKKNDEPIGLDGIGKSFGEGE